MAEAVVTFMLEQLKEVAIGYTDLISGAADDFKGLNDDLDTLKAHLKEMAKRKKDEPARKLERRIRDAVYEVEDTIDTCLTDAIKASHKFISFTNVNLAKKVKFLREKVAPLIQEAQKLVDRPGGVQDPHTESTRDIIPRQDRVVGFEEQESTITGYLLEEKEELDVISIVGIPGQGKTTLAWKVYRSDKICYHYSIRIWVNISQEFNRKDVFLQILKRFTSSQEIYSLNVEELAEKVRDCLENETFLLVLDDVWSVDTWKKIKQVLPLMNGKGKVLITTRENDVGTGASTRKPHKLEFLSPDDSWKLLQFEVYQNLVDCPQALEEIGMTIAKKCDGVPLTIIIIGGVLSTQLTRSPSIPDSLTEWEKVSENVSEALQEDNQKIKDVMALSYDRLPDDLKECFVYLGVFPEDYQIPAKMLCALWIAEGFVLLKDGKSFEESAQENLTDLITRNLLKVEKTNHMGKPKMCRVHDMIRAFCIEKSKEQNFFTEIKKANTENSQPQVQNIHRLCLHSEPSQFLSKKLNPTHARSFLCFYKQDLALKYAPAIPKFFPKLRILESKSIKFYDFPQKVVTLIHVRYLTLNIENLKSISKEIYQLWNLQTLIVETRFSYITMNANIWNMIRLRHLKTKAAIFLDCSSKSHGEAGQSLQTLDRLAPESCTDVISEKAKNLKTLGISGKLANVFATQFLEKLYRLEKLKLYSADRDLGRALPQGNCFPPNLKMLTLTNTWLRWDQHMSTLAMIKNLKALKLKANSFDGKRWAKNVGGGSFPNLELLLIADINLAVWEASTESFPSLRFLVVNNCQDLNKIPDCLGLGTRLEKLELERVSESVVESAIKIGEARKQRQETGRFAVEFVLVIDPASRLPSSKATSC